MTWRDVRFATLRSCTGWSAGRTFGAPCYCTFSPDRYFRNIRTADGIVPRLPRGWYTDVDAYETAVGIVAGISHGRFVAGYRWSENNETVIFPEIYTHEEDAARAADSHAERFAEDCREGSYRFRAMTDAESALEDAVESLRDTWHLRRAGRRDSDDVREAIETLRTAREALQDATREYES
jgi:hypothetical protein